MASSLFLILSAFCLLQSPVSGDDGDQCTQYTVWSPSCGDAVKLAAVRGGGGSGVAGPPGPPGPPGPSGATTHVAFMVNNNNGKLGPNAADADIIWPTVMYNEGNAYSANDGHFTAPVAGYYHFALTVLSVADVTASARIQLNGIPVAWAWTSVNKSYASASTSATLNLKQGDQVYVTLGLNTAIVNWNEHCQFNGFLIFNM